MKNNNKSCNNENRSYALQISRKTDKGVIYTRINLPPEAAEKFGTGKDVRFFYTGRGKKIIFTQSGGQPPDY
jgi:hypothetical protein